MMDTLFWSGLIVLIGSLMAVAVVHVLFFAFEPILGALWPPKVVEK